MTHRPDMPTTASEMEQDALTHFLTRARFDARILARRSLRGHWAIDTSGSGRIPFHLVERGSAWVHVAGSEPRRLRTGDLVLFPHDLPHAIAHDASVPPKARINIPAAAEREAQDDDEGVTRILSGFYLFESAAARVLIDDLPDTLLLLDAREHPPAPGLDHLIEATLAELADDAPGRTAALCDLARLLLLHLLRGCFSEEISSGYLRALTDPRIGHALLLIHSRYGEPWTLQRLAREVGMSRTTFAERFHDLVGLPPARYLTAWRMQEATSLLEQSTLSIEHIAERCGYHSAASFRKAYKAATGSPPRQVRSRRDTHRAAYD